MDPGQDLHQRRLAGAVLAHERRRSLRPATSKSTRSSATTPGNRLEIADICSKGRRLNGALRRGPSLGTAMASAPGGVGGRRRSSTGSSVAGRTRRRLADAGRQNTSRAAISVQETCASSGARNPDYQSVFVFDNDHPCVGADAPRQLETPPGIYRNAPADRRGARGLLHAEAQHDAGGAAGRGDRRPARRLARPVSRARRAARDPPRADLREQGRGGRRVEPASARADLRDQLRLQDHRDRSRREPALLRRARPRRSFRTSCAPSRRTVAGFCSRARRRSRSCRTSRGMPTSATSRRRRRMPAWRRCRRASCGSWPRRSSRCWSATTTCGRCRSRTC